MHWSTTSNQKTRRMTRLHESLPNRNRTDNVWFSSECHTIRHLIHSLSVCLYHTHTQKRPQSFSYEFHTIVGDLVVVNASDRQWSPNENKQLTVRAWIIHHRNGHLNDLIYDRTLAYVGPKRGVFVVTTGYNLRHCTNSPGTSRNHFTMNGIWRNDPSRWLYTNAKLISRNKQSNWTKERNGVFFNIYFPFWHSRAGRMARWKDRP